MASIEELLQTKNQKSSWSQSCCGGGSKTKRYSPQELAKLRWLKIRKLRFIILAVQAARDAADEANQEAGIDGFMPQQTGWFSRGYINPKAVWKQIFDAIVNVLILYYCIIVPLFLALRDQEENSQYDAWLIVTDIIMWVYIFLTFFTARYVDSKLVTDKRYIFWLYLKSSLIPDILANIPLFLINYNFLWLKLLWIFRLSNVTDLISNSDWINKKILPYFIVDWNNQQTALRMIISCIYLILIIHFFGCFWVWVGYEQSGGLQNTWIGDQSGEKWALYIKSIYWTIVTFSTVGYGDILPTNKTEIWCNIGVQLVGLLFFAYLMGNISNIIANSNMREQQKSAKQNSLDKWLFLLNQSRPDARFEYRLQKSITDYYDYVWDQDYYSLINESEFFMRLKPRLRRKITKLFFADEVKDYQAFFGDCTKRFQYLTVLKMFPAKFNSNMQIIEKRSEAEQIYFIKKGSVNLCSLGGVQKILQLGQGSFFGEFSTIFNQPASIAYYSGLGGCQLFCLKRDDLDDLMKEFPEDAQIIKAKAIKRERYLSNLVNHITDPDYRTPDDVPVEKYLRSLRQEYDNMDNMQEEIELHQQELKQASNSFNKVKEQYKQLGQKLNKVVGEYQNDGFLEDLSEIVQVLKQLNNSA